MNERLPYSHLRKLALLAREKISRRRLFTETDQALRNSRGLISTQAHTGKSAFEALCADSQQRYQYNDDHEDRTDKTVRVCDGGFKKREWCRADSVKKLLVHIKGRFGRGKLISLFSQVSSLPGSPRRAERTDRPRISDERHRKPADQAPVLKRAVSSRPLVVNVDTSSRAPLVVD